MKYHVIGSVKGSKYLGVYEADSAEEAIEAALNEQGGPISLCHSCSSQCEDGSVEEATAEPEVRS